MKNTPKKIKAWAVLGYPDKKPLIFGSLRGREGSMAIFENKEDAEKMNGDTPSWEIRKCEIIIK